MLSHSLSRSAYASVGPASSWRESARSAPVARGSPAQRTRRSMVTVSAASDQQDNGPNDSILDAFFVGRALAETLNERLGQVAANVFGQAATANFGPDALLAEAQKRDAEFREEVRKFQEEVLARARSERLKSSGGSQLAPPADAGGFASPAASAGSSSPPAMTASSSSAGGDKRNVSEAIDDLRSEVSRARYEVQKLKNKNS